MFAPTEYQLLDFGDGRKLEQFADCVLDRPAPVAEDISPSNPKLWSSATAQYKRTAQEKGDWSIGTPPPAEWKINWGPISLELKLTDFGHVGVFAEHATTWDWLSEQVKQAGRPIKVLNLFAYTGGASLVMAAAGAEVVHVDSARNTVAWARRNAEHSGLAAAPVRWIVEDARKFVERELKRGNHYDAVVLDPPSYGHGPGAEAWKLAEHLPELLQNCFELTGNQPRFLLLTLHTPGFERRDVQDLIQAACGSADAVQISPLELISTTGRRLSCGIQARLST